MELKLSCADFAFPLISHDAALDLIAAIGFQGVDIGLFEDRSHLRPSDQFINIQDSAASLKKSDLDFTVYAVNQIDSIRRQHARHLFLQTLEYAERLGAEHVSGLPGVAFTEESFTNSFERCIIEHAWRVTAAAQVGISYGVEAHIGSIIEEPEQALALMKSVPGLGLTLDYSHLVTP
jgi:sugar phosphate isomerase/epimerase